MTGVFLDTVGLLAVWDTSDQWHAPASGAYQNLLRRGCPLLTTNSVLLECGNVAARRPYRQRVKALREALLDDQLLVEPTSEEVVAAWDAFDRGEAGQAGIVDHLSFVVMRRLGLTESFTNDRHFQAAGFITLF
jgi:predicted nucleic acid-binding protein